jgi:glycosyltransferase involved in cell wall biosynthesis
VLAQRPSTLAEVIVVDDCSTDDTREVVEAVGDARVRIFTNEKPGGVAAARNVGVEMASGEWMAFCDDDDLWSSSKLERQLATLASHPEAGWCAASAVTVDARWKVRNIQTANFEGDIVPKVLAHNVIPGGGSGVLARADLVREAGGFDVELSMFADWDLWIRLALRSPLAVAREFLLVNRRHDGNMSLDASQCLAELDHVLQKYAPEREAHGMSDADRQMLLWIARSYASAGRRVPAVRMCLSVARRERSWRLVGRAGLAVLGPRAVTLRVGVRTHRLPAGTRNSATRLVSEVRKAPCT